MNVTCERFDDELVDESLDREASLRACVGTWGSAGGNSVGTLGSAIEH